MGCDLHRWTGAPWEQTRLGCHQKNSPLAFPNSTSLLFRVITPSLSVHFHLLLVRATFSNCAKTKFVLWPSSPLMPGASSSLSELRVSPLSSAAAIFASTASTVTMALPFSSPSFASPSFSLPPSPPRLGTLSPLRLSAFRFTPCAPGPAGLAASSALFLFFSSTSSSVSLVSDPVSSTLCSQSVANVRNEVSSSCSVLKSARTPSTTFRITCRYSAATSITCHGR
mmetsp:Transcript_23090/g.37075  ORF Transcript_23090/g.37075 Transcript_23090/m.37075 type:complete len:226 (+) Transcript_23090:737-1414(+)